MRTVVSVVTIAARFNGPDHSGNGGYCCGLIASQMAFDGPRTVTLRLPPPLDAPLSWEHADETVRLLTAGGAIVGEGQPGKFVREAPPAPTAAQATAGDAAYPGHSHHPFGGCFTCGPLRDEGDGLRVFSGPIEPGSLTTAAPWTPHEAHADADGRILDPITWAAIDCAGGWTADFNQHPTLLGRMTGQVFRAPEVGESCVVTGHLSIHDGRKFLTDTALYAGEELLARSEQVWIEIDLASLA